MRTSLKKSYSSSLLDLVEQYLDAGGKTPYSTRDVAEWAISQGHWDRKATAVAICARDISRALREDYYTDTKGRLVRARHSVRVAGELPDGGMKQKTFWNDHRRMDYDFAERSFKQRRMQIVGDCKQLKTDVDSYNDAHGDQPAIQLVLNFTYDILEDESVSHRPPSKPR